jgi:hypothetical protein
MEYRRNNHVAAGLSRYNQTQCLPIVIIRDPFAWMQSMVREKRTSSIIHSFIIMSQ